MSTKNVLKTAFIALLALAGLSACSGLEYSTTNQEIDAPVTVTATAISDTRISVTWSSQLAMGAFKYYVQQSQAGGPFIHVGSVLEPSTSFVSVNLTPATQYSYQIVAVATDGSESVPSSPPASATTLGQNGTPPTNVTATTVSETRILVQWSAVMGAFKYYVQQSQAGGPFLHVGSVLDPNTSFLAVNLTPNTTYSYQIVAVFTDGSESAPSSPPASATTSGSSLISPPTGVMAQAISDSRITVSWNTVANAAKYFVLRSLAYNGPYTNIGAAIAPDTMFLDVGLAASTEYFYRIVAVDVNDNESTPSLPPAAATTFAPGGGVFEGYWKFDEETGTVALDSSGFFRHGTLSGGAAFTTADLPQIDDNASAVSFPAGSTAQVTVPNAQGFNLNNDFTVALWVKLPAAADVKLVGLRAAGCGPLGWELAQDSANGFHFASESGIRSSGLFIPVGSWTHVAITNNLGTYALYFNGVEVAGGSYTPLNSTANPLTMGHVGGCAGGAVLLDDVQIYSRALSAANVATIGTLPPAPTGLVVTAKSSVSIDLAWDPVPGATSYILSKGTAAGNETFYSHVPASAMYQVDHLTPNTQYSFNVRAVVNGLFSNAGPSLVDTTLGPPPAPANVVATVVAPDRISVTWDAVSVATKYYVYQSISGGAFTYVNSVVAPGTMHLAVNLAAGTTYSYQIQSEDIGQTIGPFSAPVSATTP